MALWDSCLLYFPAKLLSGPEERQRDAYKSDPSKMTSIVGWMVVMASNPEQPDAFQLTDPVRGNAYKFRAGSRRQALEWVQKIKAATKTQAPEVRACKKTDAVLTSIEIPTVMHKHFLCSRYPKI